MAQATAQDPRYRRVRERLVRTLLDMAGTRPAESISVSELTSVAGVSRAAFYAHSTSPSALLADTLISEITPDLAAAMTEMSDPHADYPGVWRGVYLDLLDHVRRHRAVYEVITSRESSVGSALIASFEELTEPCVRQITTRLDGDAPTELWTQIAITQQAHNMISVIRAWIMTDLADPPEMVVDTYLSLAPPWQLARADEHGTISLRRSRHHAPPSAATPPGSSPDVIVET